MVNKMTEELKTLVETQIELKKKQELEKVEKQIKEDEEVINRAVELINNHTLYKKISKYNNYIYELANEKMFESDYIKEPKHTWQKGIKFHEDSFTDKVNKGIIEVNGEVYCDIRYALNSYEKYVDKLTSSLTYLDDEIRKKRKELETLKENFPTLKKAIEDWQAYEKENR